MQQEGVNVPRAERTAYARLRRQCEQNGYCRGWGLPNEMWKLKGRLRRRPQMEECVDHILQAMEEKLTDSSCAVVEQHNPHL